MPMALDFIHVFYDSGGSNCFGEMLFRLIAKADYENRRLLKRGFEKEVLLYEWWVSSVEASTPEKVHEMADIIEKEMDRAQR